MVANSGKLSTMSTTASNTLTDKVDSPHSGLFQALHVMAQGNYALKDHASTLGLHTLQVVVLLLLRLLQVKFFQMENI